MMTENVNHLFSVIKAGVSEETGKQSILIRSTYIGFSPEVIFMLQDKNTKTESDIPQIEMEFESFVRLSSLSLELQNQVRKHLGLTEVK